MTEDPKGRLDILLRRLAREVCARIEAQTGGDLWEKGGIRKFVDQKIREFNIPAEPIDLPATLCRNVLKLLPDPGSYRLRRFQPHTTPRRRRKSHV